VYFDQENCAGTPLLILQGTLGETRPTLLPLVAVALPGHTVYLAENEGPAQTFYYTSTLKAISATEPYNHGGQCENIGSISPINARQATPLIDLDTLFTPPFRAR